MRQTRKQRLPEAKCDCGQHTIPAGSDFVMASFARRDEHWRHACGQGPPEIEPTTSTTKKKPGASR